MSNFGFPKTVLRDASGNALVGAKVYFYEVGTTTLKNTYQDYALSVLNTNPVVTDSNGATPALFAIADAYKIVATTSAGVALPQYSHDVCWPSKMDDGSAVDVSSSSSTPAVKGTNSSSGPAGRFVNSGTGTALEVEGDASSPVRSPVYIKPVNATPSSPLKGDIYVDSVTGLIRGHDGAKQVNYEGVVYVGFNSTVSGTGTYSQTCTIPANSLRVGSKIAIKASIYLTSLTGTRVDYELKLGSSVLRTSSNATPGTVTDINGEIYIASLGATGSVIWAGTHAPITVNTTIANAITLTATLVGSASSTTCDLLTVTQG